MHLKRISLSGFKSFARPSTLEFTTPVTAVVGPNGSGKSNIAEGIRFVLGEQSIKSLRGKKTEDLIFNGSHTVSRLNKASVEIVFDNKDRIFDMDYDEVSVRRTVYRDGEGIYSVNGSRVRLKDVLELLAHVHIGASSHHIISQGEADRILLAPPKDRRNMIEDALGLKIYQYKRIESERKLLKTKENIERVEALRKEIAPHLKFLTGQVEKVRRAEKIKEDLAVIYAEYIGREERYLALQKGKIESEKIAPEKELKSAEREIEGLEHGLASGRASQGRNPEMKRLEESLQNIRSEKDVYGRRIGRLEGIIEYAETGMQKSDDAREEERHATIPYEAIATLEQEIISYAVRAGENGEASALKEIIGKMRDRVVSFAVLWKQKAGTVASSLSMTKEELAGKREEKKAIETSLQELARKERDLQSSYINARNLAEREKESERENERKIFALQNRRTELLSRIELVRVKEEQLDSLTERLRNELRESEVLMGSLRRSWASEASDEEILNEPRSVQEGRSKKIERMKIKIEEIGVGGEEILKEYNEVVERDQFLEREVNDLTKSADSLNGLIQELGEKIEIEFKEGLGNINKKFDELFALVFGGGKASLRLVSPETKAKRKVGDESDDGYPEEIPEENADAIHAEPDGVEISISLPRKKIKSLEMLSGGERALTSIALIFAMTQIKPPPFLILDETDAALDEANSRKYGDMLRELSKHTQLVLITHNRETMGNAGVLYGVTAVEGISRLLSVRFEEAQELAQTS